jgi:hypothetical protein
MDKRFAIITIVLVLLLVLCVLYLIGTGSAPAVHTTSNPITSTTPVNATNSAQAKLLNGGGAGNSYISKTELGGIMPGNNASAYASALCNRTYQSNSISCASIFPKYQGLYGQNTTVWLVSYSTPTEILSEVVTKSNINGARHEYDSFISNNTIFYNYNKTAILFNRTINATLDNGTYSVFSQQAVKSNSSVYLSSKPAAKGQKVVALNLMLAAKGQEVATMVLISSYYNTTLNTALIKRAINDMP